MENKPELFKQTLYKLPTKQQLIDLDKHNLSSEDIFNGFNYVMVGRGMMSAQNKQLIVDGITMLCELFPTNDEYKKALEKAKNIKSRFIQENIMKNKKELIKESIKVILEDVRYKQFCKENNCEYNNMNEDDDDCGYPIEESTYDIDANDPNMQQKINKIKNDSTLFNKDTDEINIKTESVYTKSELFKILSEAKAKKTNKSKNDDQIKAVKKADRELEQELNGPGFKANTKVHKNDKKYNRKSISKGDLLEIFNQK